MLYYIKVETKRLIAIFFSKGQKHHLWPAEQTVLKDQLQEAGRFKPLHFGTRGEGEMERKSSSAEINTLLPNPFSWSWTTLPSALLPTFTNFL